MYMPSVFARGGPIPGSVLKIFFFVFITLDTGPQRPLSLEWSDTNVYELEKINTSSPMSLRARLFEIRARLYEP